MNHNKEKLKLRARGKAAHYTPTSKSAEQFHMLQQAIELLDNRVSTILITSPNNGEGTSTTSANLAIVAAQTGKKVLLVDANFRTPCLQSMFNIESGEGLSDILLGKTSLGQSTNYSGVQNVDIVINGNLEGDIHPSHLLNSPLMHQLVKEVKNNYDLIIFDAPALLPYSDGQILSQYSDGAILVLRNRQTPRKEAVKAKERLEASKVNVLGVVFNYNTKKRFA